MMRDDERSKELEDSELDSISGGTGSDDQPPPEDDGREPTGTDPNDDGTVPSDDPLEGPVR